MKHFEPCILEEFNLYQSYKYVPQEGVLVFPQIEPIKALMQQNLRDFKRGVFINFF